MKTILLVVACILHNSCGKVLIARRPLEKDLGGLWEFPGGKIEPGETPEEALIRELNEEIGIKIDKSRLVPFSFISYPYDAFHLLMPVYICSIANDVALSVEGQEIRWVYPEDLHAYSMPPADIDLVPCLIDFLSVSAS